MKVAIHNSKNSFSPHWIEYCEANRIPYKLVDAYSNDIVQQVEDCDAFMWHHHHGTLADTLLAKQLLYSLQQAGKRVYPDFPTTWHFDDKVGQKYLLESISAPLVPSFVFYNKEDAIKWLSSCTYPKVFKLRGGAGASNVKLVRSFSDAKKIAVKCFGKGYPHYRAIDIVKENFSKYKAGKVPFYKVVKSLGRLLCPSKEAKNVVRDRGYLYLQEFIPNNTFDVRIVIIAQKYALAERRKVRPNDFRASGSGTYLYDSINEDAIKIAFDVAKKLVLQSVAFDFVLKEDKPLIVEMSYCFGTSGICHTPGYWTDDMVWHSENFNMYGWMVENLIK